MDGSLRVIGAAVATALVFSATTWLLSAHGTHRMRLALARFPQLKEAVLPARRSRLTTRVLIAALIVLVASVLLPSTQYRDIERSVVTQPFFDALRRISNISHADAAWPTDLSCTVAMLSCGIMLASVLYRTPSRRGSILRILEHARTPALRDVDIVAAQLAYISNVHFVEKVRTAEEALRDATTLAAFWRKVLLHVHNPSAPIPALLLPSGPHPAFVTARMRSAFRTPMLGWLVTLVVIVLATLSAVPLGLHFRESLTSLLTHKG